MNAAVAVLWCVLIAVALSGYLLRQWAYSYAPSRSIHRWLDVSTGLISGGLGAWAGSAGVLAWRALS